MNLASELRASLADMKLPEGQVDEIIKSAIASGGVQDDETTGGLAPDVVKSLMADLKTELTPVADGSAAEPLAKAETPPAAIDTDGEYIDVEATLDSVVKSANANTAMLRALVERASGADSSLAKGLLALGQLTEHALAQTERLAKAVAVQHNQFEAIGQRLGIPVPPRAVTGATPMPHPGELAKSATGQVVPIQNLPDLQTLHNAILGEQRALDGSPDPMAVQKSQRLADAVGKLSSGFSIDEVLNAYPEVKRLVSAA